MFAGFPASEEGPEEAAVAVVQVAVRMVHPGVALSSVSIRLLFDHPYLSCSYPNIPSYVYTSSGTAGGVAPDSKETTLSATLFAWFSLLGYVSADPQQQHRIRTSIVSPFIQNTRTPHGHLILFFRSLLTTLYVSHLLSNWPSNTLKKTSVWSALAFQDTYPPDNLALPRDSNLLSSVPNPR